MIHKQSSSSRPHHLALDLSLLVLTTAAVYPCCSALLCCTRHGHPLPVRKHAPLHFAWAFSSLTAPSHLPLSLIRHSFLSRPKLVHTLPLFSASSTSPPTSPRHSLRLRHSQFDGQLTTVYSSYTHLSRVWLKGSEPETLHIPQLHNQHNHDDTCFDLSGTRSRHSLRLPSGLPAVQALLPLKQRSVHDTPHRTVVEANAPSPYHASTNPIDPHPPRLISRPQSTSPSQLIYSRYRTQINSYTMTRILRTALAASILSLLTSSVVAQSTATSVQPAGAISTLACYDTLGSVPDEANDSTFQTSGLCQTYCTSKGAKVMATSGGTSCYCGDTLPSNAHKVDDDQCNIGCGGFDKQMCGGIGTYQFYLTGLGAPKVDSDDASSSAKASATASSTSAANTVVVTEEPSSTPSADGGPSKVGIAVGVVVGVLAVAAIVGGGVFFWKRRRNQQLEEEHARNAAISGFAKSGSKSETSSANDSRLDPSIYSARRDSLGSIADERDFSRRILQVCSSPITNSNTCLTISRFGIPTVKAERRMYRCVLHYTTLAHT